MKLERKIVGFEMKAASEDGSEFEGYASCFHNIDSYGDIIAPGAFVDTLAFFLNEGFIGGLNHDWDQPIGKPTEAREDVRGLYSKAKISATSHGEDVKVLLKDGVIKKLSIGFRIIAREWLDTSADVIAYWEKNGYKPTPEDIANCAYGARLITKIKLYEYSPVTVPANSACDITGVKENGEPASIQLPDHFLRVLAANEELVERVSGLVQKRAEDNRTISEQRIAQVKKLRDQLDELLRKSEPVEAPTAEEIAAQEAEAAEAKSAAQRKLFERRGALLQLQADLVNIP